MGRLELVWQDRGPDVLAGSFGPLEARVWRDGRLGWMWRLDGKPPVAGTSGVSWFGSADTRKACVAEVEERAAEVMEDAGLEMPGVGRKA